MGAARTVVFVHAHPDDEAIFTGGTIALLAARGWRVVLVVATHGERGLPVITPGGVEDLGALRVAETRRAAELLGVARVEFLGYEDSGLADDAAHLAPRAFAAASLDEAADRLVQVIAREQPGAVVTYDAAGIYGHADHVKAHEVTVVAAAAAGVGTLYEATVDREYLHFVETHLVVEAGGGRPHGLGLAATTLGLPTVLVSCTVDVRSVLTVKRAAMEAHASQIPETSSALRMALADFTAVYGYEWFGRRGPAGPLEELPQL
jgi:LmbE family N-acetylglucosaminyl deacetylase